MTKDQRGIYRKFNVERTDGSEKHASCFYFVLDCDHDFHALAAMRAYRDSCRAEFPALAEDIDRLLREHPFGVTGGNWSDRGDR